MLSKDKKRKVPQQEWMVKFTDRSIFHQLETMRQANWNSHGSESTSSLSCSQAATKRNGRCLMYSKKCARTSRVGKQNEGGFWTKGGGKGQAMRDTVGTKMEDNIGKKQSISDMLNQLLSLGSPTLAHPPSSPASNGAQKRTWKRTKIWQGTRNLNKKNKTTQGNKNDTKGRPNNQFSGWTKGTSSQFQSLDNSFVKP